MPDGHSLARIVAGFDPHPSSQRARPTSGRIANESERISFSVSQTVSLWRTDVSKPLLQKQLRMEAEVGIGRFPHFRPLQNPRLRVREYLDFKGFQAVLDTSP